MPACPQSQAIWRREPNWGKEWCYCKLLVILFKKKEGREERKKETWFVGVRSLSV